MPLKFGTRKIKTEFKSVIFISNDNENLNSNRD